jgi:hypothetical protein
MPTAYPVLFDGVGSAKPVGYDPERTALPVWFRQTIGGLQIIDASENVYSGNAFPYDAAYAALLADTTLGESIFGASYYQSQITGAGGANVEAILTQIRFRSIREYDPGIAASKVDTWASTFLSCVDRVKLLTGVSVFNLGRAFSAANLRWGLTETKPESGAEAVAACTHSEYVAGDGDYVLDMAVEAKTLDNLVQSDYDYEVTGEVSKPVWLVRFFEPTELIDPPTGTTFVFSCNEIDGIEIFTSAY